MPKLKIPATCDTLIVFIFNRGAKTYNKDFYLPAMTDDQVSSDEINQVLEQIGLIAANYLQDLGSLKNKRKASLLFWICLYLYALYANTNHGVQTGDESIMQLILTIIGLFIIFAIIFCIDHTCRFANKSRKIGEQAMEQAIKVIDNINPIFAGRGMRWEVPAVFPWWIGLHLEYRKQERRNTDYYLPPHLSL